MRRIFFLLTCCLSLSACSIPDVECFICDKDIYSGNAKTIYDEWCCKDCYDDTDRCEHCGEKYLDGVDGYCEPCIENGSVLCCDYCNKLFPEEDILKDLYINGNLLWYTCYRCYDEQLEDICGTSRQDTWGKLFESNGGNPIYSTLTAEQRSLVKYPYLNFNEVFWTPEGTAYHSVDWCYTLDNSTIVYSCTLPEAVLGGLTGCSKCVYE